jgi:predicted acyl esterase
MGGCMLGSDMPNWASIMLAYNALPPDPAVVGERWRDMWFQRLDGVPPFLEAWMSHQRRDAFWKQGSVDEDYSAINCPVYAVGGWVDPYTNSVPRLLEQLTVPRKGLIGPWVHSYPHTASPEPAIGFLQECLRWWDCWLKDIDTGMMDEPMLRVWMPEGVVPEPFEAEWPGRWVAEPSWPPAQVSEQTYYCSDERLEQRPGNARQVTLVGAQINGSTAGVWCPYGNKFGMPIDQRVDDGLSLCFTSTPAKEAVEILGFPEVRLKISSDQPNALVAVRLCDVAPEGDTRLVSWGLLNLTHRNGHEDLEPLAPGEVYTVRVQLNVAAHRLKNGHRWKLAISPTYWPHAWPSPVAVTLTVHTGEGSALVLPVRTAGLLDERLKPFEEPEGAPMLEHEALRVADATRTVSYDVTSGRMQTVDVNDEGRMRLANGLIYDSRILNTYSIFERQPTSATAECRRQIEISRGEWNTRVETYSLMTSDTEFFHLTNILNAYEGRIRVFTKTWTKKIPRDMV